VPTFAYTAIDTQGHAATGTLVAASEAIARQRLEAGGMTVRSLGASRGPTLLDYSQEPRGIKAAAVRWFGGVRRTGVPGSAVTGFYRDLAIMLDAGIGIREGLQTMRQQAASASLIFLAIVTQIHDHVADGGTLAEGMARFPDVFEDLEIRAVEAGQLAGITDESLRRLADLRERRHRLKQKVITALTYPAMVLGIALLVTLLLMTFVVPTIIAPLVEESASIPLPTRIVKTASDLLLSAWWLLILLAVGGVFLFRWWIRTPAGGRAWDAFVLHVPVFGGLILKHTVARAATIIATLLRSGIGLVEALKVAQDTCPNVILRDGIARWEDGVNDGLAPDVALANAHAFPPLMVEMVAVGTQSGKMEDTLDKLAETYEHQVQDTADRLAALVEPAMMIFLGALVLLIILAVFLPYLQILTLWS
jgi:type IV pilus assembly protein PilC